MKCSNNTGNARNVAEEVEHLCFPSYLHQAAG